jgi:hypothetical protein
VHVVNVKHAKYSDKQYDDKRGYGYYYGYSANSYSTANSHAYGTAYNGTNANGYTNSNAYTGTSNRLVRSKHICFSQWHSCHGNRFKLAIQPLCRNR